MLLTDTAIRQALDEGRLGIEPPPPEERYDPVSVDLSLGATFLTWDVARAEEAFGEVPAVRIRGYNYLSLALSSPVKGKEGVTCAETERCCIKF